MFSCSLWWRIAVWMYLVEIVPDKGATVSGTSADIIVSCCESPQSLIVMVMPCYVNIPSDIVLAPADRGVCWLSKHQLQHFSLRCWLTPSLAPNESYRLFHGRTHSRRLPQCWIPTQQKKCLCYPLNILLVRMFHIFWRHIKPKFAIRF